MMKFYLKKWGIDLNFIRNLDKTKVKKQVITNGIVFGMWLILYIIKEIIE